MWLEPCAESSRQEDKQRHEPFPDGTARRLGVGDDIWKQPFHALHSKAGEDFTETLSCSLSVDARRICFECAQQAWNKIWEVDFAQSLNERPERFSGGGTGFGDRVHKDDMHHREKT